MRWTLARLVFGAVVVVAFITVFLNLPSGDPVYDRLVEIARTTDIPADWKATPTNVTEPVCPLVNRQSLGRILQRMGQPADASSVTIRASRGPWFFAEHRQLDIEMALDGCEAQLRVVPSFAL